MARQGRRMPNLLAHYAAQGPLSRFLFPAQPARWILLGCLLPDLPWILQRMVHATGLGPDPYVLRTFFTVQSSLLFCLLLAGTVAAWAPRPGPCFLLLGSNAIVHLALDASQRKWGGGPFFLAPFTWTTPGPGWYWPESPVTIILTVAGAGYALLEIRRDGYLRRAVRPAVRGRSVAVSGGLLAAYVLLPLPLLAAADRADAGGARTLRQVELRPGRPVQFDRIPLLVNDGRRVVKTYAGEEIEVRLDSPIQPGLVSLQGRFVDERTIQVDQVHVHHRWFRDAASYAGLLVLLILWLPELIRQAAAWMRGPGGQGAS